MNLKRIGVICICVLFGGAMAAHGAVHSLFADLDGAQAGTPSPGTGMVTLELDDVTGDVTILSGSFMDLLSDANNAHIHGLAPPGTPAGVLIPLTFTASTSGTIGGSGTLSPVNVQGMLDGLTYVNLHSDQYPGGEIRGQIVPEPATAGLGLVMGTLLLVRRRKV